MDGPGSAWRWARRPLWAALAGGVIGAGAAQAQQPPVAPPVAGGAGAMPAEIPWALQPPSSGPAGPSAPAAGPAGAAAPPVGAGVFEPAAALTSPPAPAPAA